MNDGKETGLLSNSIFIFRFSAVSCCCRIGFLPLEESIQILEGASFLALGSSYFLACVDCSSCQRHFGRLLFFVSIIFILFILVFYVFCYYTFPSIYPTQSSGAKLRIHSEIQSLIWCAHVHVFLFNIYIYIYIYI